VISTFTVGGAYGALPRFRHYPKLLIEGPRGTAKSRSILGYFLALLFEFPGSRLLLCRRYRAELTKTILTTLEDEVFPAFGVPVPGGPHRSGRSEYRLDNGSTIWPAGIDDGMGVLSMGITYAYAAEVIEMEEETVTDISGGLRWLRSPERPTLPEHAQLIMDTNPGAPSHWANQRAEPVDNRLRFVRTPEDYINLQRHNYAPAKDPVKRWKRIVTRHQDNPGYWDHRAWDFTPLGRTYVTQQLEGLTGHKRERWLNGLWKSAEGAVFPGFDENAHAIRPFNVPEEWPIYQFYDPGFDHPTGISWVTIAPNRRHYVIDEMKESGKSLAEWSSLIRRREEDRGWKYRIAGRFADPHGAYNRTPGGDECVAEQMRVSHGLTFARWPGSRGQKEAMVEKMRDALARPLADGRPALMIFNNCTATINEFQSWRYKRDHNNQPRQGDDQYEDANNDILDGLLGCVAMNLSPARQRIQVVRRDDDSPIEMKRPSGVQIVNSRSGRTQRRSRDPLAGLHSGSRIRA
jgi:hypothetical protein